MKLPKIYKAALKLLINDSINESALNDFEDQYVQKYSVSKLSAAIWIMVQIFILIPNYIVDITYKKVYMLKNYLKIAIRNIIGNKVYSVINVTGLSLGIAFTTLMILYVSFENSYDNFHEKNIYRVYQSKKKFDGLINVSASTPFPLAAFLKENISSITSTVRLNTSPTDVTYLNKTLSEKIFLVEPSFFEVFNFKMLSGNKNNPFEEKYSVVLRKEIAEKYFGDEDPIGKVLGIYLDENVDFKVTGILENTPKNSSIEYDFLIDYDHIRRFTMDSWHSSYGISVPNTFITFDKSISKDEMENKLEIANAKYLEHYEGKLEKIEVKLQGVEEMHFGTNVPEGEFEVRDPMYLYIFSIISIFVLFIAVINFTTLSIGRSISRAKDVGVRKVIGARKSQIISQYTVESILTVLISMILGVVIAGVSIDVFNNILGMELNLEINKMIIIAMFSLTLIISAGAGLYPALLMASFNPSSIIKGDSLITNKNRFSKVLIMLQFGISIFLIISTLTISDQMFFMNNKNLGYDKANLVQIEIPESIEDEVKMISTFENEALKNPEIESVTAISTKFGRGWSHIGVNTEDDEELKYFYNVVTSKFIKTVKLELVSGRGFSEDLASDQTESVIVNEEFVRVNNIVDPIGKKLPGIYDHNITIIGVVKDFNYMSLHNSAQPTVLGLTLMTIRSGVESLNGGNGIDFDYSNIIVRIKNENVAQGIEKLRENFKMIAPTSQFTYSFIDDVIGKQYMYESNLLRILNYSTGLGILLACLGLFGLSVLTVEKRIKEIGVRKILGASSLGIFRSISKEFMVLVVVSNIIGWPTAYFAISSWLSNFAYQIDFPYSNFVFAAIAIFTVAMLTLSFKVLKAANGDPVNALRSE